jgi:polyisoprenoid-binding protein YceI
MRMLLCLALFAASVSATAADWKPLSGSTLGFTGSFQGESFEGRFEKFDAQIRFDPAKLSESRFDVRIDLGTADTQNDDRDVMLRSEDFFDSRKRPEARFVASRFRALGGNRFIADGVLTLNGISKAVPLSFSWIAGAKPALDGEAQLKRLDFAVGSGDWADTELLPNEVKVHTHLLLGAVSAARK